MRLIDQEMCGCLLVAGSEKQQITGVTDDRQENKSQRRLLASESEREG